MPTASAISLTEAEPACRRARMRSRLGADSAWMLSAALREPVVAEQAGDVAVIAAVGHRRRNIAE